MSDINPAVLRRALNRFAARYQSRAQVVEEIGRRLLAHMEPLSFDPGLVIDVGGGSGAFTTALAGQCAGSEVIAVNSAWRRLSGPRRAARSWWPGGRRHAPGRLCAAVDRLPIADGSCAALVSNLALAALGEPDATLATWARALRPGAPCVLATLGPDSLKELRQGLAAGGQPATVHPFYDMHDIGDALIRAGFSGPVLDVERLTVTYASFDELLTELRVLGGFSALRSRPRGLRTPAWLAALARNYAQIAASGGVLKVTLEVVYAHAWRRTGADRPQDGSTVAKFPIDQLRARR